MSKDVILFILVGCFFSYLGYLFKFKQKINLISGLDASKVKDVAGLANWVGANMFLLAIFALLMAGLQFLYPHLSATLAPVFGVVVLASAIFTVVVGRKYMQRNAAEELQTTSLAESAAAQVTDEPPVAQLDAKERTPLERVLHDGESKRKARL